MCTWARSEGARAGQRTRARAHARRQEERPTRHADRRRGPAVHLRACTPRRWHDPTGRAVEPRSARSDQPSSSRRRTRAARASRTRARRSSRGSSTTTASAGSTSPASSRSAGTPTGPSCESFAPDFYLPDLDLYLELTTLKQSLVRRKNRKLRYLRELYPMIRIKLFYARDFRALLLKYRRLDVAATLIGGEGQVRPSGVPEPVLVAAAALPGVQVGGALPGGGGRGSRGPQLPADTARRGRCRRGARGSHPRRARRDPLRSRTASRT